jgi:glycosyltransferase involved in cell wall biosynthesis
MSPALRKRIVYVVNPPVFFISHRKALAEAARADGYDVSVISPQGEGVETIMAAGFDWHPMRFDAGGMNPVRDFASIRDLLRLFRELKPDIVHNVTVKPVLYGTLAARLAGVPRVINAISGLGYLFSGTRPLQRLLGIVLYHVLMRHSDMRVILQNREDLALFRKYGLAPNNTLRLIRGSGVDISCFAPGSRPQGPPVVLQVSRMVGDKGVREFIQAAAMVRTTHPEVRFVLAGPLYSGNPSALTEGELRDAERGGTVTWIGPRDDVATLLAEASIFCLPSYREGLPKALLEAGACGLPSVTTDTSGCREVVRDGHNGLLVPVANAAALAAAIEKLLADPEAAWAMGTRARSTVEQDFALDRVVAAQLALYREMPLQP